MDGQLDLARRPPTSTDWIADAERQFDNPAPVGRNLLLRFADWIEPTEGTVGTAGAVGRALVCVLLCLLGTLAIIGAVYGGAAAIGWIASLV